MIYFLQIELKPHDTRAFENRLTMLLLQYTAFIITAAAAKLPWHVGCVSQRKDRERLQQRILLPAAWVWGQYFVVLSARIHKVAEITVVKMFSRKVDATRFFKRYTFPLNTKHFVRYYKYNLLYKNPTLSNTSST